MELRRLHASYFYKGLRPFLPSFFDRLRWLAPDTSPGIYPWYFTRVRQLRYTVTDRGFFKRGHIVIHIRNSSYNKCLNRTILICSYLHCLIVANQTFVMVLLEDINFFQLCGVCLFRIINWSRRSSFYGLSTPFQSSSKRLPSVLRVYLHILRSYFQNIWFWAHLLLVIWNRQGPV